LSSFTIGIEDTGDLTAIARLALWVAAMPSVTSISLNPTTTTFPQTVAYSANVTGATGTPSGTITFAAGSSFEDQTAVCTADLSAGTGTCSSSNAPVGTDVVTAYYSGNSAFTPSSGTTNLIVDKAPTLVGDPLVLQAGSQPYGVTGQKYQYTFSASGFPSPTITLADAPSWLTINSSGVVSGTPPAGTRSFSYSVVASNGVSPDAIGGPYDTPVATLPAFTADAPPTSVTVGSPYTYTFAASGYPTPAYTLTGAPSWLSINPTSGQLTGTPPAETTSFSYSVTATSANIFGATVGPFAATDGPVSVMVTPAVTKVQLTPPAVGLAATPDGHGYWIAGASGGVSPHGDATSFGSMAGHPLDSPIAHIVSTPDGQGYWLVASDGGVFSFGDAGFFGSMGGQPLNAPVVDLAPTPDGKGYWLVASDGGIFAFGDAVFRGSMGGQALNRPIVGIAPDDVTGGYWEVASDGGIFAFGAPFYGSTGSLSLNNPVNGMTATPNDRGYWFVASDGGVFAFGDAAFHGSAGGFTLDAPIVGMAANDTGGYWLVGADGGIFAYGAPFYGSD
jgi:hypothetical protein